MANILDSDRSSFWGTYNFEKHSLPVANPLPDISSFFRRDRYCYTHRIYRFSAQLLDMLRREHENAKANQFTEQKTISSLSVTEKDKDKRTGSSMSLSTDVNGGQISSRPVHAGSLEQFFDEERRKEAMQVPAEEPTDQNMTRSDSTLSAKNTYVDKTEKWRTIELLYTAIKFYSLIQSILVDCQFFQVYPELEPENSLVTVIFCDYQSHGFHRPGALARLKEKLDPRCTTVETAMHDMRTRLAACLARARVKAQASTLDAMLPPLTRHRVELGAKMPTRAWCSRPKLPLFDVHTTLLQNGFTFKPPERPKTISDIARRNWHLMKLMTSTFGAARRESSMLRNLADAAAQNKPAIEIKDTLPSIARDSKLSRNNTSVLEMMQFMPAIRNYTVDFHCEDVFVFDTNAKEALYKLDLLKKCGLILQDKTSCLAVQAFRMIANEQGDVLVVNDSSGLTSIHLLNVLQANGFEGRVIVCNVFVDEFAIHQVQSTLEKFSANGVRFMPHSILDINPEEAFFKKVKSVLLLAPCNKSAIHNPVDWIVNEGEDLSILAEFAPSSGIDLTRNRLAATASLCRQVLTKVLRFTRVNAIVYVSRSNEPAEGADLVLETVADRQLYCTKKTVQPYRILPPTLQISPKDITDHLDETGKFLRFPPSAEMNGCFIATLAREASDIAEAQAVLHRALTKGILQPTKAQAKSLKKRKRHRKSKKSSAKSTGEVQQNELPSASEQEQ